VCVCACVLKLTLASLTNLAANLHIVDPDHTTPSGGAVLKRDLVGAALERHGPHNHTAALLHGHLRS
jgi:hypothetical protein